MNDLLLRAIKREPIPRTPLWIMRQAGRYLPEYRITRQKAGDFMTLCKTPELACEVTLQPVTRYPLDAAIIFSDILTIPDALGLGLQFVEHEGPQFSHPVRDSMAIKKLPILDPFADLGYVAQAIRLVSHELKDKIPLIGFSGSPWTLATYMIEGKSSKDFYFSKRMLFQEPFLLHHLLETLTANVTAYLQMQIQAGVDLVMLFDTWGGVLSSRDYLEFSLSYMQQIVQQIKSHTPTVPIILFTKNGGAWLEKIANTACDVVAIDWVQDIAQARQRIGSKVAIQGNLDPAVLYGSPERIRQEVAHVLDNYGNGSGHIFNLGHGITPHVDPENVAILIDAVHKISFKYHKTD